MKLAILFSILAITLLGCTPTPQEQKDIDTLRDMRNQAYLNKYVNETVQYSQDQRTGLCFAMIGSDPRSLTYVPCSDAVFKVMMAPK